MVLLMSTARARPVDASSPPSRAVSVRRRSVRIALRGLLLTVLSPRNTLLVAALGGIVLFFTSRALWFAGDNARSKSKVEAAEENVAGQ
jgi:hypothetical protein